MKMSSFPSFAALTVEAGICETNGLTLLMTRLPAMNPSRELCIVRVASSAEKRMSAQTGHSGQSEATKDDQVVVFVVEPNGNASIQH